MQIIPVLDLLDGVVVRGVAGRRSEYRPVVSRLTTACDALSVARAFSSRLGLGLLYLADLDAILHQSPNLQIYRALAGDGFQLLVDAGLREIAGAKPVIEAGATKVIAGLETWPGPGELAKLCADLGPERVIFSLDLVGGAALGQSGEWGTSDPFEIGCRAVQCGVTEMIILDIAQVGVSGGVTTAGLCRRLKQRFADLSIITGGGVRDVADLRNLGDFGVSGMLIASALHDGRIGIQEIATVAGDRLLESP
jgi:phosphoribosylformimino-5-aminoimidazole carboxamide ribotide isomerase